MHPQERIGARTTFEHGSDCSVRFIGQDDNRGAEVDVFEIMIAGDVYQLQMMKMRFKARSEPWVFGSFGPVSGSQTWAFKKDLRKQQYAFKGDVYTVDHNDVTYVLYVQQGGGVLAHIVPLVELLANPRVDPDSDAYIAEYGDLYDQMQEIAQKLNLALPEDVQELLERDTDDIEANLAS